MPEMHLREPQFTYSTCKPFTKHKQRIQKLEETGDKKYIYKNELDKACFAHDAAYSHSKDLTKRTAADKILKDKAFNIVKDPKYDEHQRGLASMVYKFFDKKSKGSGVSTLANKSAIKYVSQNQQLAEELHKSILKIKKKEECTRHLKTIFGVPI